MGLVFGSAILRAQCLVLIDHYGSGPGGSNQPYHGPFMLSPMAEAQPTTQPLTRERRKAGWRPGQSSLKKVS